MSQAAGVLTNVARLAITLGLGGSVLNASLFTGKIVKPLSRVCVSLWSVEMVWRWLHIVASGLFFKIGDCSGWWAPSSYL